MPYEPTQEEAEQGYYICGTFRNRPQFQCLACAFDALDEWRIRDHVINRHQMAVIEAQKKKQLTATLYDSSGRIITERDKIDGEN
jgi:hypothetical protein